MATSRQPKSSQPAGGAPVVNPDTAAENATETANEPDAGSLDTTASGQALTGGPAVQPAETVQQAGAPAADGDTEARGEDSRYAPYPGAGFFHAGRHHALFRAMGRRLVAEGAGRYTGTPGGDWTNEHARSYAAWQEQQGVEPTGTPDEQSWAALRVPKT